ncbi:ABC transporter substrate-binding protein [Photobacterium lipolyticum]|uniref:ABC transporter substrate-binding protein n=1 Tax=Photobacterium lipolyticum TaxID=266810 RepID=A0A2T3MVT2_9GAMM|nr:ABC transporter substrate-binding protein [Photobacterium lipolyticum]PSW04067.1 ABC transporter substrate-binding protein [Photobacterium lipolyticum]
MIRLLLLLLIISPGCIAAPTNHLIILTTFTESAITPITLEFQKQYPDAKIKVLHRRGESGVRLLEKNGHDIDIVISSSQFTLQPLIEQNKLIELTADITHSQLIQPFRQSQSANIVIFGYSGYGLMWNKDYLAKHNLDIPVNWENLTHPQYFRHVIMSSPYRSGTTHLMVENILQRYGWKDGWKLLLQIGGNLASISARSFGVSDAISRGLAGIGPVIDSFAYESQRQFPFIGFNYQNHSPQIPSYIAAVNNTHQSKHSLALIKYLLSDEVQAKLPTSSLHKYGLKQKTVPSYTRQPLNMPLMRHRKALVKQLFEQTISHQLVLLNQAWQLIHKLNTVQNLTDEHRRQFNLAIRLASTPPVTETQANSDMYHELSLSRTDVQTARCINAWRRIMGSQLEQSIALSQKIIAEREGSK